MCTGTENCALVALGLLVNSSPGDDFKISVEEEETFQNIEK